MSPDSIEIMLTSVEDHDVLYRRLAPHCLTEGGGVTSAAFKTNGKPDHAISTDLARMTTPDESVNRQGRAGFQLGEMVARGPRELGFRVDHDPLPNNKAHTLIVGANTMGLCRKLARLVHVVPNVRSGA